ncbi:hypothetical protein sr12455 [Sporisorium reilianum SRZ2]|uniref:C2H2-type domain-containing protein n=1 Tax=Sporisorium reilianum (strain SRZ2) TaxID=999809 RepID=E6ZTK2_SPORE|nr:hypothetical protein sr12455 [Sporisorium reilianum SRZ2]
MPSLIVLIPGTGGDTPTQRSSAAPSPVRQRKPLSLPTSSSSSVVVSIPALPSSSRRTLQPSSSSSSLSSSSLLRNHSGSSSSASSSTSEPSSSRHRKGRHDRPIDISNPFGDDVYNSAKRIAPFGQAVYSCRWRLRDKKGVLDPNGHQYCDAQLMTPDLLARHVLTQHIDQRSAALDPPLKIACKWNSCFNRHYDPAGLAAHLVHDHFTNQMGLRYACVSTRCPVKTILTSFEALDRHHAQYHSGYLSSQLRKVWQPRRPHKDPRKAAKLLAALRKLDAMHSRASIPVSVDANPKLAPVDPRVRRLRHTELKRRFMDPLNVELGEAQQGQPWIRLQKRIDKRTQHEASRQAADDAILRATDYDQNDLGRVAPVCVETPGDPTLRAIEDGLQSAQLYHTGRASSSKLMARKPPDLTLPPEGDAQVVLSEGEGWEDSIGAASLHSIERQMRFDAALSKQQRWADRVLRGSVAPKLAAAQDPAADEDSDDERADWVSPLPLVPYHPAARSRFALVEDSDATPRAMLHHPPQSNPHAPSSGHTSPTSSRLTSPTATSRTSSLTPISDPTPDRLKRHRDHDDTSLHEPPASRLKLEEAYIDLTRSSDDGRDDVRFEALRRVFGEIAPNARAMSSPGGHRLRGVSGKSEARARPASVS